MRIPIGILAVTSAFHVAHVSAQERTALGGHVALGRENLQLIAPSTVRPTCAGTPFSVDEIARVGKDSIVMLPVGISPQGKPTLKRFVKLKARNDKPERTVSIEAYVDELNKAEAFYNAHGLTLRRGPFALRVLANARRRGPACQPRQDRPGGLINAPMIRYRLVDTPPGSRTNGPWVEPGSVPELKPNPPGPGDVMGGLTGWSTNPIINPADLTDAGRNRLLVETGLLARIAALPRTTRIQAPPLTPMSGNTCTTACSAEFVPGKTLTNEAIALIQRPDEVVEEKFTCNLEHLTKENAKDCETEFGGKKTKVGQTTRREQWAKAGLDVDFFVANHAEPCKVFAKHKASASHSLMVLLYNLDKSDQGTGSMISGTAAPNFFDGVLGFTRKGIADCVLDVGSNGFFGAEFCVRYSSDNQYVPSTGFSVRNSAGIITGVTLFGMNFNLLEGDAVVTWKQPRSVSLVQPAVTSSIPVVEEVRHFDGPGATFLIGPIPFSVTTWASAGVSAGKPQLKFEGPASPASISPPRVVGVHAGAESDVSVGADAAIDAVILSAGVSGKLSLLKNNVTGGIDSIIHPAANQLNIEKTYQFKSEALKGSIAAFIEIDLLVYRERYEVELVSFPGISKALQPQKEAWGPAQAVLPSTANQSPSCPK